VSITVEILAYRGPLRDQRRSQLEMFLGLEPKRIGQIGAGKERITGEIDVAISPCSKKAARHSSLPSAPLASLSSQPSSTELGRNAKRLQVTAGVSFSVEPRGIEPLTSRVRF
jgi:hypothetical protein